MYVCIERVPPWNTGHLWGIKKFSCFKWRPLLWGGTRYPLGMYNIERSPFFRGSFFPRRIHVNKSVHLEAQVQYVRAATYIIMMCYNFVPSPTNSCVAWSHSGAARIPFVTRAKKAFLTCTHTHTHENPSYAHR